jgi:hypothetical protein
MPPERSSPEPRRFSGEDEEGELEGFGEADVVEFDGGGPSA